MRMRLNFDLGGAARLLRGRVLARRDRPPAGRLRADGANALGEAGIGPRLGLSGREIHNRVTALSRRGLWRPSSRRFSEEELERVAALAATRAPKHEIADRLDLTAEEVSARKQALRRRGHHLPWPRYR